MIGSPTTTGVDVTGADVTGADETGADVTGADVTGADVTGADVTGADEGHTFNPAIRSLPSFICIIVIAGPLCK